MRPLLMFAAIAISAPIAAADIIFSDTEFLTSTWGVESVLIGGGGSGTPSQVLGGGNPGAYRQVDMTPGSTTGDAIYTLHRYGTSTATRYDPATQGAIFSLDFHLDYRALEGAVPVTYQKIFVGAKQGTVVFAGPSLQAAPSSLFNTLNFSGMTAADFSAIGGPGSLDLSATGAPIRFGFITYVVNTTGPNSSRSNYDNFSVTVHQAPAPGSLALIGLAGGILVRRRRR